MFAMFLVWMAGVGTGVAKVLVITGLIVALLSFAIYGIRYLNWAESRYPQTQDKPPFKFFCRLVVAGIISMILGMAIPSERTAYMMGAAYLGQKALQSDTADKLVELMNVKLDEYIKEETGKIASDVLKKKED